jgi:murein DD-endopeptidase MepM/ murein hydrolase activator NlpD
MLVRKRLLFLIALTLANCADPTSSARISSHVVSTTANASSYASDLSDLCDVPSDGTSLNCTAGTPGPGYYGVIAGTFPTSWSGGSYPFCGSSGTYGSEGFSGTGPEWFAINGGTGCNNFPQDYWVGFFSSQSGPYDPDHIVGYIQLRRTAPGVWTKTSDGGFDYPVGFGECSEHTFASYRVEADLLDPKYRGAPHTGEDWNRSDGDSDLGDPVCAVASGTVMAASSFPRWSNVVVIKHDLPDGAVRWSQYGHLGSMLVTTGQTVSRGQQIGTIGKQFPGRACIVEGPEAGRYCAHLHFEIRQQDVSPDNWPGVEALVRQQYLDPTDVRRDVNPERGFIEGHR